MARPQKNNLDYFPHDNSMRNDRKVKALRSKFGLEGYAIYNMLLETICESDLLVIEWNKMEIELISGDLTIVSDKLTTVSDYLNEIGLLKIQNGYLFSPELDKRSKTVFGKRIKELNSLRIENGINFTETHVSDLITIDKKTETPQSKVKESKVKESKLNDGFNFKKSFLNLGVEEKIISDWLKVRSKKKATNSETSFNTLKSQMEKSGIAINDCVRLCTIKDWKAFNAEWVNDEDLKMLGVERKKENDLFDVPKYKFEMRAMNTTLVHESNSEKEAKQKFYNEFGMYPTEIRTI